MVEINIRIKILTESEKRFKGWSRVIVTAEENLNFSKFVVFVVQFLLTFEDLSS